MPSAIIGLFILELHVAVFYIRGLFLSHVSVVCPFFNCWVVISVVGTDHSFCSPGDIWLFPIPLCLLSDRC